MQPEFYSGKNKQIFIFLVLVIGTGNVWKELPKPVFKRKSNVDYAVDKKLTELNRFSTFSHLNFFPKTGISMLRKK